MPFQPQSHYIQSSARIYGGLITQDSGTQVSIPAGKIAITTRNATNPQRNWTRPVVFGANNLITPTALATANNTFYSIDANGSLVERTEIPNAAQSRNEVWIAAVVHPGGTIISAVPTTFTPYSEIPLAMSDLFRAVGDINVQGGGQYTFNGTNLSVNKTAGTAVTLQRLIALNPDNPNEVPHGAISVVTLAPSYRDGLGGFTDGPAATTIDVGQWDDGSGTLQAVGANEWAAHRLYFAAGPNRTFVQSPQEVFSGGSAQQDAINALRNNDFELDPNLLEIPPHTAVVARGGATDLSNPSDAVFIQASRFGTF